MPLSEPQRRVEEPGGSVDARRRGVEGSKPGVEWKVFALWKWRDQKQLDLFRKLTWEEVLRDLHHHEAAKIKRENEIETGEESWHIKD